MYFAALLSDGLHWTYRWQKQEHPLCGMHAQVIYHVYEDKELRPLLDAVNQETAKEKEEGA